MPLSLFTCCHCGTIKFGFYSYCRHLKQYHENENGFKIGCSFENCKSTYTKVNSYVKHVVRCHKAVVSHDPQDTQNIMNSDSSNCKVCNNDDTDDRTETEQSEMQSETEHMITDDRCTSLDQMFTNIEHHCASFVLGLREKHTIPAVVQDEVVSGVKHLLSQALVNYRDVISSELQNGVASSTVCSDELSSVLNIEQRCDAVGKHVESEYALLRYLDQGGKIVMPQTIAIDSHRPKQTFQYVPVLQVLQKVLCNDDIMDHFSNKNERRDSVMEDFCDGVLFKSDDFFKENPSAIRIHMYSDEFEVCNPIGAKKGKHKIVAFYYTIGNFHPKWRSQTRWIFLAILVKQQFLTANGVGYEAVLKPLLADLRCLEETGVTVVTDVNGSKTFKGKLVSISGDNLSAHAIAGFQQHFHAGRICRTCLADYSEISTKFVQNDFKLRTADMQSYHVHAVEVNVQNATVYGVKGPCSFAQHLHQFDVTKSFPHDIMHDLLEGVLPLTTRLVLAHFVQAKQLDDVNNVLAQLHLAHANNRPNRLNAASLSSHITGTAAQKLELFFLLPRLLAPFVDLDAESDVWTVYLYLREICDIVLAPVVDRNTLTSLDDLVCRYLTLYTEVFGEDRVIPKHHYMVHYSYHMSLFGPLRHMWCMRFEGKHKYFKNISTASKSFKNITKTLAKRHQMRQSWEMSSSSILERSPEVKNSVVVHFVDLPVELRQCLCTVLQVDICDSEQLSSVSSLSRDCSYFKLNCVYVLGVVEEESVPVFLYVKKIICVRDVWLVCGKLLVPVTFKSAYHAFAVEANTEWLVVKPGQLLDHIKHDVFHMDGQQYVSMRYAVIGC